MGQNSSFESEDGQDFGFTNEEGFLLHAKILADIASLSYDNFVQQLGELNKLSKKYLGGSGKQLVFAVKKGSDSTILWKGTVRICCIKVDTATSAVESYRLLHLLEFMRVSSTLREHMSCIEASKRAPLTASLLLHHVDQLSGGSAGSVGSAGERSKECCICLERQHEVILPCTHSYCLPCIEQWNVNNKTCPICRERLETTEDAWEISEAPDADEVKAEIRSVLNDLSNLSPKHHTP